MSNVTAEQYAAVQQELEKLPVFNSLSKQVKLFLIAGLAGKDILGALTTAGMSQDIAVLATAGILKDSAAVQSVVAFALGLIPYEAGRLPDSGGPKTEPVPVPLAEQAEKQIAAEAIPTQVADALTGLTVAAPKAIEKAAQDRWLEETLTKARKKFPQPQLSAWVN